MKMKTLLLSAFLFFSCSTQVKKQRMVDSLPESLKEAVSANSRASENTERDEYQHPLETLDFFGIKPDMTVVEISPGAGYYTEILAPFLAKEGQYVIAVPRLPSRPPKILIQNEKKIQDILLGHTDIQTKTRIIPFEPLNKRNKTKTSFADMVVTFSSVHNWVATKSTDQSFKFFYEILKPGGILGLVQHRAPEGKDVSPMSGYIHEKTVIALAEKAGFKLMSKSEINANPKDSADYPKGVWVLPPTYRLGDQNRDKYEDIGESDKMTLKFIKK
jgi:predicted methyltransferase